MAADGKGIPMINSFLNLCRVCPVPTDDKVNSEYKRNFTWHDGYQTAKSEVIKNAPTIATNQAAEPSLSRKKRHPELAHRAHELLYDNEEGESSDSLDTVAAAGISTYDKADTDTRARIIDGDEKDEICVSKKTDEKQPVSVTLMTQSYPPRYNPGTPGEEGVCKTTEYRSQFVAYPRTPSEAVTTARKSASMGFITQPAGKRDVTDGDITVIDAWGVRPSDEGDDDDAALDAVKRGRIKKTEYKAKFRPFSAYTYVDGNWKKATKLIKDNEPPVDVDPNSWYSEVVERLKKADQYRVRSHAGVPLYGDQQPPIPPELMGHIRERTILSPVSVAASTSRTWKDERPTKERPRPAPAPVHHRKEKREVTESPEHPKSREGSTKKKPQVEKTTVRPKSAEPVIPHTKEHRSSPKHQPKTTRPRAPKDLPVPGHGDLSGRKRAASRQDKSSPVGSKPRAVPRPGGAVSVVNGDDGKVWMKPDSAKEPGKEEKGGDVIVNGYPESSKPDTGMVNGEVEDSVQDHDQIQDEKDHATPRPIQPPISKPPIRVPLTTVKSPEEVTGVRSPDPESWTVPLEIGKGLHWMDGKTPDGVQTKTPPIFLSKRFKESSLVGKSQKDLVLCDPGSASTEDTVDL